MTIDLNCDLGEGSGQDALIIPLITSANVSCGAHAGSTDEILATLQLCLRHGIVVGAHPGHADPGHFGRRELPISPRDVFLETDRQITFLKNLSADVGLTVRYIKPHGGLYHQACRLPEYAQAIAEVATKHHLPVVGLPESQLRVRAGSRFIAEGFADRAYREDGSLVPRSEANALITQVEVAVAQVKRLMQVGVQTICVHGDNPKAREFVHAIRLALQEANIQIKSFA